MQKLRIIIDDARPAAFNMAADLLLLGRAAQENTVFLRFYGWEPPAVSLGCMQDPEPLLDFDAMRAAGVAWVKRPTGGRAILHWNDLTYSIAFPSGAPGFGATIQESYAAVSRCLVAGLSRAGIVCGPHDSLIEYAASRREIKLPCFLSPNRNEIMAKGRKLVGSAQKRTDNAVLQHGSIPMDGSFRRLPEFCRISPEERARQTAQLEEKCTSIREIRAAADRETIVSALIEGFRETSGYHVVEKTWDPTEIGAIDDFGARRRSS